MTVQALINRYKQDAIISSPRGDLVMKLYDGALSNLHQALRELEKNERASFGLYVGKGQAIIAELLNCLDHKVGGEISKNLEKLYLFVIDRLLNANLKREASGIRESIHILKTLQEGWNNATRKTREQQI